MSALDATSRRALLPLRQQHSSAELDLRPGQHRNHINAVYEMEPSWATGYPAPLTAPKYNRAGDNFTLVQPDTFLPEQQRMGEAARRAELKARMASNGAKDEYD
jgi:hypothetical protein